jgi:4-hydroxybenzoate-CoA ligase
MRSTMPTNLAQALLDAHPDAGSFSLETIDTTTGVRRALRRAPLRDRVLRVSAGVRDRTSPGDRVFVQCTCPLETAVGFLGVIAAGRVAAPIREDLPAGELRRLAAVARPALLLSDRSAFPGAPPAPCSVVHISDVEACATEPNGYHAPALSEAAFLIFTSGTTSAPRGALHGHHWHEGRERIRQHWTGVGADDRFLHTGRMFWTYALGTGLADALLADATTMLFAATPTTDELIRAIQTTSPTVIATVPAWIRRVVRAGFAAPHIVRATFASARAVLSAGERLDACLRTDFEAMTGVPLHEAYGCTESSTFISTRPGQPTRAGWIGPVQPGRRVELVDPETGIPFEGPGTGALRILPDDPGLFLRYLSAPKSRSTPEPASMRAPHPTGDLLERDAAGWYRYLGRRDAQLNVHGVRLHPLEIESVLHQHPDVSEVAVNAVEFDGRDLLCAWVVFSHTPTDESSLVAHLERLREWTAGELAAHKRPHLYRAIPSLPRTSSGKLLRTGLPRRLTDP